MYLFLSCALFFSCNEADLANRTGTSVDDGARKSNNWLDQWQSDKLGTGSQVLSFSRAFPSSKDVRVLLLNQPIVYIVTRYMYDAWRRDFALSARFVLRVF